MEVIIFLVILLSVSIWVMWQVYLPIVILRNTRRSGRAIIERFRKLESTYNVMLVSTPTGTELDRFLRRSADILAKIDEYSDDRWRQADCKKVLALHVRLAQMNSLLIARVGTSNEGGTQAIKTLSELRHTGMLTEQEFEAFTERFKASSGERAQGIVNAISDLFAQRKMGALMESNYRAAVWSLLDKLERKT